MLLETRVKLQNILNIVNMFPQNKTYESIFQSLKPEVKEATKEIIQESKKKKFYFNNNNNNLFIFCFR
jgi:hypothetical protein